MDTVSVELLLFAAALLGTGLIAGLLAGLLGVGGGIVIVPVLFHLFAALGIDTGIKMQMAVGTSLATIIATSLRSIDGHRRKGTVDLGILKLWAAPMIIGVTLASYLSRYISGDVMVGVFGSIALLVSLNMAVGSSALQIASELPGRIAQTSISFVSGFVSTIMGIGGGTIGVPILSLYGVPIHRAVGTSSGFGILIAVPGTIGFIVAGLDAENLPVGSIGYVNMIGVLLIIPSSMLVAPYGATLAHRISSVTLARAFSVFLGLTAVQMLVSLLF
ncbi:sulfite exporter TauE/SafE family protein [Pseudomaricurvus alkylphenolicus]|jgi:uncharacterized membrane protein YfcA|uniref:sulfite exporter TauE/SafE family protein n=1 Tax=Pseudomaricurvus alkylphenolicus TaxID=1306991 RepID=UPI001420AA20|nr:sulfite exporter TauE/SafE family protein [Pseudomaricurvus alkylphenolicus]NIB40706.1 sulfite exporter TauE/SafE family protein [Pseudomaricurvus alkylphenolicus]